jgi:hypothetical protein
MKDSVENGSYVYLDCTGVSLRGKVFLPPRALCVLLSRISRQIQHLPKFNAEKTCGLRPSGSQPPGKARARYGKSPLYDLIP